MVTMLAEAPTTFLWINKTPRSKTLSKSPSREVSQTIRSHVQRHRAKVRRKARVIFRASKIAPTLRSSTSGRSLVQVDSGPTLVHRKAASTKPNQDYMQQSQPGNEGSTVRARFEKGLGSNDPSEARDESGKAPPLPLIRIQGASIEPFAMTSLPLSGHVPVLIQYWVLSTLPSTNRVHPEPFGTSTQLAHELAVRSIASGALEQQSHIYSLLAVASIRMQRVSGTTFRRYESPELFLQKAIHSLRTTLADPCALNDKQVVLDIFFLAVCQWYMQDFDASRIHFVSIHNLWKAIDPQRSAIEKYVHSMVRSNDIFLAIEAEQPPLFEIPPMPKPLATQRTKLIASFIYLNFSNPSMPLLGNSFVKLASTNRFSHKVNSIICKVPLLLEVYHFTTLKPALVTPADMKWLADQSQHLLYSFYASSPQGPAALVRISLIILISWLSTSAAWRAGRFNANKLAKKLRTRMERDGCGSGDDMKNISIAHMGGAGYDLLFWVLLTGLSAVNEDDLERAWFAVRARKVAEHLRLRELIAVESLLHSFVYLPVLQGEIVRGWWHATFS